jgi:hypothetical protein
MDNEIPTLVKADNILIGNKPFSIDDPIFQKLTQNIQYTHNNYTPPKIPDYVIKNPHKKSEDLLEQVVDNQGVEITEIRAIRYENMKLNAQVDTLNKLNDEQKTELENLRQINIQLEKTNSILEEEKKNATKSTVFWSIITGIFLLLIEHWKNIYDFILSLIG